MRLLAAIISFATLLGGGAARAQRPTIEVRLVADSGGATFHTRDGQPVQLGPSLLPSPVAVSRARASGAAVQLTLGASAASPLAEATARNQGRRLAIVVGGVVQCAPVIKAPIEDAQMLITLDSSEEAAALAKSLTSK